MNKNSERKYYDINGRLVANGDKVRGFGVCRFQDGWTVDLTPEVTARLVDGVMMFGGLSAMSFNRFEIVTPSQP